MSYHITFLDKDVSRAWLTEYAVKKFTGKEDLKDLGTVSIWFHSVKNTGVAEFSSHFSMIGLFFLFPLFSSTP